MDNVDTLECGVTKACFRSPDDCTTDCEFVLTWTIDEQGGANFEMSASATSNNYWVTFGLSYDQDMVKKIWKHLSLLIQV